MTAEEKKVLEEIRDTLPLLAEQDKERLLWFCKGMATKKEKESTHDTEKRED